MYLQQYILNSNGVEYEAAITKVSSLRQSKETFATEQYSEEYLDMRAISANRSLQCSVQQVLVAVYHLVGVMPAPRPTPCHRYHNVHDAPEMASACHE